MFWGCFSYDFKGPCHIWVPETLKEQKEAAEVLDKLNKEIEPKLKEDWELTTGVRRMGLRNLGGPKPKWRLTKKNGKLVREGKGGIDWYRYFETFYIDISRFLRLI